MPRPDVGFIIKTYADIKRAAKERRRNLHGLPGRHRPGERHEPDGGFLQPGPPLVRPHLPGPEPVRRRLRRAIPVRAPASWASSSSKLDELGIVIDTSRRHRHHHSDCANTSQRPIMATHTAARAIVDTPRNKTDDEIKDHHGQGRRDQHRREVRLSPEGRPGDRQHHQRHDRHVVYIAGLDRRDHVGIGDRRRRLRKVQ